LDVYAIPVVDDVAIAVDDVTIAVDEEGIAGGSLPLTFVGGGLAAQRLFLSS